MDIADRQSHILQEVLEEGALTKDLQLVLVLLAFSYHSLDVILKRGIVDNVALYIMTGVLRREVPLFLLSLGLCI